MKQGILAAQCTRQTTVSRHTYARWLHIISNEVLVMRNVLVSMSYTEPSSIDEEP